MKARILRRLAREEHGIALVMALGILTVSAIMVVTVVQYTSSSQRTAHLSKARLTAFDAADAGMNNALAVLNLATNNSLHQNILPACHTANPGGMTNVSWYSGTNGFTSRSGWNHNTYGNATVDWCGDLDLLTNQWFLWSVGSLRNPTGPSASAVTRRLFAIVPVTPILTQPLNNPSWNYIYATRTGNACDQSFANNVGGQARLYVAGNLCVKQNVGITNGPLIVRGNLDVENNAFVGAKTSMATRVETYVGGNCRYQKVSMTFHTCSGNQDAYNIFSKLSDGATIAVSHTPASIGAPAADFNAWYADAMPGPRQACTSSSGTPPTFDNDSSRNNSVGTVADLTPTSSYTCRVGAGANTTLSSAITSGATTMAVASNSAFPTTTPFTIRIDEEQMTVTSGAGTNTWTITRAANGTTAAAHSANAAVTWESGITDGELSWNATSKTLTVKGTVYIDGSAKISQASNYNGQATIYLSGTMRFDGSLCGVPTGSTCVFSNWNPNTELLTFVADGTGGQIPAGDSVYVANNMYFQGGVFATGNAEYSNNASSDGPIMASQIIFANNMTTNSFPTITTVPVGMPGNDDVHAQPNPPKSFSG